MKTMAVEHGMVILGFLQELAVPPLGNGRDCKERTGREVSGALANGSLRVHGYEGKMRD